MLPLVGMLLPTVHAAPSFPLAPAQLERLNEVLERMHEGYDPEARMLTTKISGYNYHSSLREGTAHPVRQSANYAVALMDSGDEEMRVRALGVLNEVLKLQDTDPDSRTYGIWPYYLEEPFDRMLAPDWNWADFIGAQLLEIRLTHEERLPDDMKARIDNAIRHAANSIRKRDMGPHYTNIAIMGAFVTLVTAETYGIDDLREYAMARWRKFHKHTMELGGFNEFNSPTYTKVALDELMRALNYVKDPDALEIVREIYHLAWKEIAVRYHPPSGQWAGPHSRAYSSLLRGGPREMTDRVTGTVSQPPDHRLKHECPPDLVPYFEELKESRQVVQTFAGGNHPVIGTTWLTPEFALGTVNRGDLWNQRRSLIAYWGDAKAPAYLHLRFMRDGYDYAAARFFSVQEKGDVIAAINFATDGGDKHVSLDRIKEGTIVTGDFRMRLEFGGSAGDLEISAPPELGIPAMVSHGGVSIEVVVPHAVVGDMEGRWEAGSGDGTVWLDVVFHAGEETTLNFSEMDAAALGLALRIAPEGPSGDPPSSAVAAVEGGILSLRWREMEVGIPVKPDKQDALRQAAGLRVPER